MAEYYAANEAWTEAGSLMWSLFGHDGECCSWVDHNDGYTIQWGSDTHKDEAFALAQVRCSFQRLLNRTDTPGSTGTGKGD